MILSTVVMSEKESQEHQRLVNVTHHTGSHRFAENKGQIFKGTKVSSIKSHWDLSSNVYFGDVLDSLLTSTTEQSKCNRPPSYHRQSPRSLMTHIQLWIETAVAIKHKKLPHCVGLLATALFLCFFPVYLTLISGLWVTATCLAQALAASYLSSECMIQSLTLALLFSLVDYWLLSVLTLRPSLPDFAPEPKFLLVPNFQLPGLWFQVHGFSHNLLTFNSLHPCFVSLMLHLPYRKYSK